MKIVIAIDSFKGSLSSLQAGEAAAEGIKRVYPNAEIELFPMADGGEGTVDALTSAGGTLQKIKVTGPLGRPVEAAYGILEGNRAVMEMSAAAGITLIGPEERNPLETTTFGVGEMIRDAIQKGCRSFLIGIGGSATNDGGLGMLQALGFEFLDEEGTPLPLGGKGLEKLAKISAEKALPALKDCVFRIACDVKNPLCGEQSCSAVYGPQKGATPEMIQKMDGWLKKYAALTKEWNPAADENFPGAGAAGGMGFAFLAYLQGELTPGVDLVMQELKLEEAIRNADLAVTGEGRLDGQSYMGKAPVGVAKLAKKYQKPVIAFSGCATPEARICNQHGIDAFFPVLRTPCSLEEAMDLENAKNNMTDTAEQVFRLWKGAQQ